MKQIDVYKRQGLHRAILVRFWISRPMKKAKMLMVMPKNGDAKISLMMLFPPVHKLQGQPDGKGGCDEGDKGADNADHQDGDEIFHQDIQIIDHADTGRDEEKCHVGQQKV